MSAQPSFDHVFKIVLTGCSGVGKTNLLSRFTKNVFNTDERSTVGVEYGTKIVEQADKKIVKAQIWDTAGQERYRSIVNVYYRSALGAVLIYDVTKKSSFDNVPEWLKEIKSNATTEIQFILIGNKSDLCAADSSSREVTYAQGEQLAKKRLECSFLKLAQKQEKTSTQLLKR